MVNTEMDVEALQRSLKCHWQLMPVHCDNSIVIIGCNVSNTRGRTRWASWSGMRQNMLHCVPGEVDYNEIVGARTGTRHITVLSDLANQ